LRLDRIELRPDRLAVEPPAPLSTTSLRPQKIPFDYFCAENLDKMLEMVEDKELQDVVAASGVRGASQPEIMVFYFQIIF
jgi:hypothetical protein